MLNEFGFDDKRFEQVFVLNIERKDIYAIWNDMPVRNAVASIVENIFSLPQNVLPRFREFQNEIEHRISFKKQATVWNKENPVMVKHPEYYKKMLNLLACIQNPELKCAGDAKKMREVIINSEIGE